MSVEIQMQGRLEPVVSGQDFIEVVRHMNMSLKAGEPLCVLERDDGEPVAISIPNVLSIEEVD